MKLFEGSNKSTINCGLASDRFHTKTMKQHNMQPSNQNQMRSNQVTERTSLLNAKHDSHMQTAPQYMYPLDTRVDEIINHSLLSSENKEKALKILHENFIDTLGIWARLNDSQREKYGDGLVAILNTCLTPKH